MKTFGICCFLAAATCHLDVAQVEAAFSPAAGAVLGLASLLTNKGHSTRTAGGDADYAATTIIITRLFSTPPSPPLRQPRRNLQKRPRKGRKPDGKSAYTMPASEEFPWETAESRSLIASAAREAGEDYWIDLEELKRQKQREEQIRARDPGQIPDQKLWTEVLSPYKQNWIGLISVSIIALAFIFKNFPEVINPPVIANIPALL